METTSEKKTTATQKLEEHNKRFKQRVEKVTEGVYSAIGYGLANSILICTDEGNIIIDTTESLSAAEKIKEEFDKISPKKTAAIIYTHGHTDHIRGASVFMDEDTEVYAHSKTKEFFNEQFNMLEPILTHRGARQFGIKVPRKYIPSSGLGPFLHMDRRKPEIIFPTKEFDNHLDIEIGGVHLQLVSAPGETDDHIYVWMPEKEIVFSADNYYPCFPNLYTIRGTTPRPVLGWINSLDKIRALNASIMVPSHAEPIYTKERVYELLTMYRDAIQYVHDGVIRGMNEGKTPDELVDDIQLPPKLTAYAELQELYGSIAQAIRAIFDGYVGWFDGNATNLSQLPNKDRAEKYIELAGGFDQVMTAISQAIYTEEYQWAAELSDLLLTVSPDNVEITNTKAEALFQLGLETANANNRSYYISQALELKGEIQLPERTKEIQYAFAKKMDIEQFFLKMKIILHPMKSSDTEVTINLYLNDQEQWYQLHIRRGVLEVQTNRAKNCDLEITTTADEWKQIILSIKDLSSSLDENLLEINGQPSTLEKVIHLFQV